MTKYDRGYTIALIVIIALQLIMMFYFAFQKQVYFIDEVFSHSRANSFFKDGYLFEQTLYNKWTDTDNLSKLIVVPEEHRFAYNSVFFNQISGVHPPLYYIILHTVCSFFPETFSKWYGLSINFILFVLGAIYLFLVSQKIFVNKYLAFFPLILWGFSVGAINSVTLIRMYMLLTVLIVMFVYYHFELIKRNITFNSINKIFLITLAGFLTHYHFLIFFFIWVSVFFLSWLTQKRWEKALIYISVLSAAIFVGFIIFPNSLNHLIISERGDEAINNIASFVHLPIRFSTYLSFLSRELFGGLLRLLILVMASITLIKRIQLLITRKAIQVDKIDNSSSIQPEIDSNKSIITVLYDNLFLFSLTLSFIGTFTIVSNISLLFDSRYLYFLYPVASLLAVLYLEKFFLLITMNKKLAFIGVILSIFVILPFSHINADVKWLYPNYSEVLQDEFVLSDYDSIYVTNHPYRINAIVFELLNLRSVYLIDFVNAHALSRIIEEKKSEDGLILYIDRIKNYDDVLVTLPLTDLGRIKWLYNTFYSAAYLIEF